MKLASSTSGVISTIAGGLGNGSPTNVAQNPYSVAVDGSGRIIIADYDHDIVYRYDPSTGQETVIAGDGVDATSGVGGPATSAGILGPYGVAVDTHGNIAISSYNHLIEVVAESTGTFYGQSMTAGDIYTVAGGGSSLGSDEIGTSDQLALQDSGIQANPVSFDADGNMLISNDSEFVEQVLAESSGTDFGISMTAGYIYTIAGSGTYSSTPPANGTSAATASFGHSYDIVVDHSGNLIFPSVYSDGPSVLLAVAESNGTYYNIPMTKGDIYTIAGGGSSLASGVSATSAELVGPDGLAVDSSGNVIVGDRGGYDGGNQTDIGVLATSTGTFYGQSMTADDFYIIAGNGTQTDNGQQGDGGPATSAEFHSIEGIALDSHGNLLVADAFDRNLRVVADSSGTYYGKGMTAQDIYTVAGTGWLEYSGDYGSATSAELDVPEGLSLDPTGGVVFADEEQISSESYGGTVRTVPTVTHSMLGRTLVGGNMYTMAGGGPDYDDQLMTDTAVDSSGDLLIVSGSTIVMIPAISGTYYGQTMTAGDQYTLESGLGSTTGIALDHWGNLVFTNGNEVEVLAAQSTSTGTTFYDKSMTDGDTYVIAGSSTAGHSGDGGLATSAELDDPEAVAIDTFGNVEAVGSSPITSTRKCRSGAINGSPECAVERYVEWSSSRPDGPNGSARLHLGERPGQGQRSGH